MFAMKSITALFFLGAACAQVGQQVLQDYTDENFRNDIDWDFVTKGIRLSTADGLSNDYLIPYTLRTKIQDPSKLAVDTVKQYSGYLDDEENDRHLFYWFFESRNDPQNDPVVLWLNGGAGCSSLLGLFFELGPSTIDEDLHTQFNQYSWNSNASTIFIDQPINTGFSYSNSASVNNSFAAADDMHALLSLFFTQFPEYAQQDFHIAGESYAGHYIPPLAETILTRKDQYSNINLKSILIGNGLGDIATQSLYYGPMACGEGGWPTILNETQCQTMDDAASRCFELVERCYQGDSEYCVIAEQYWEANLLQPYMDTGLNPYDVRVPCNDSKGTGHCYPGQDYFTEYLRQDFVRKELGARINFEDCSSSVMDGFVSSGDFSKPIHRLVPSILEEIPVLIYAGDADFICNWLGVQAWVDKLEWPGQKGFNEAELQVITMDGEAIGKIKQYGNFAFMRVFDAGHMVPTDQPAASLNFLNRWIGGEWSP